MWYLTRTDLTSLRSSQALTCKQDNLDSETENKAEAKRLPK